MRTWVGEAGKRVRVWRNVESGTVFDGMGYRGVDIAGKGEGKERRGGKRRGE